MFQSYFWWSKSVVPITKNILHELWGLTKIDFSFFRNLLIICAIITFLCFLRPQKWSWPHTPQSQQNIVWYLFVFFSRTQPNLYFFAKNKIIAGYGNSYPVSNSKTRKCTNKICNFKLLIGNGNLLPNRKR